MFSTEYQCSYFVLETTNSITVFIPGTTYTVLTRLILLSPSAGVCSGRGLARKGGRWKGAMLEEEFTGVWSARTRIAQVVQ